MRIDRFTLCSILPLPDCTVYFRHYITQLLHTEKSHNWKKKERNELETKKQEFCFWLCCLSTANLGKSFHISELFFHIYKMWGGLGRWISTKTLKISLFSASRLLLSYVRVVMSKPRAFTLIKYNLYVLLFYSVY